MNNTLSSYFQDLLQHEGVITISTECDNCPSHNSRPAAPLRNHRFQRSERSTIILESEDRFVPEVSLLRDSDRSSSSSSPDFSPKAPFRRSSLTAPDLQKATASIGAAPLVTMLLDEEIEMEQLFELDSATDKSFSPTKRSSSVTRITI